MSLNRGCGWEYGRIIFVIQTNNFWNHTRITYTSIGFACWTGSYLCRFTGRTPRRLFALRRFRMNFRWSRMERIYGRRYWEMSCVRTSFFKNRKWRLTCIESLPLPPSMPPSMTMPTPFIQNIITVCEPTSLSINI